MKNSLRITFLLPHLKVSGGVRIILMYASLLAKRGHRVFICVRSQSPLRRLLGNLLHRIPGWFPRLYGARILRVAEFTEKDLPNADVIVASPVKTALDIAELPPAKGKKFYFIQHDEGLYHAERSLADQSYTLPFQKIVVATWLKNLLKEKYGQDSFLLLNPVDRELFHPAPHDKHDGIRILLLDHTYDWKGTEEGVRVVLALKKKYPAIRLIGFGVRNKESKHEFDEYYYDLPQEKLPWLYSNADIFLCPSWDEGFGLPSLEAMACRTAVVTYDNGGSRDFASHEATALVAPRRDTERLAEELERLVSDAVLREKIAREGYEFALTMPTWEQQVIRFEGILLDGVKTSP